MVLSILRQKSLLNRVMSFLIIYVKLLGSDIDRGQKNSLRDGASSHKQESHFFLKKLRVAPLVMKIHNTSQTISIFLNILTSRSRKTGLEVLETVYNNM